MRPSWNWLARRYAAFIFLITKERDMKLGILARTQRERKRTERKMRGISSGEGGSR